MCHHQQNINYLELSKYKFTHLNMQVLIQSKTAVCDYGTSDSNKLFNYQPGFCFKFGFNVNSSVGNGLNQRLSLGDHLRPESSKLLLGYWNK